MEPVSQFTLQQFDLAQGAEVVAMFNRWSQAMHGVNQEDLEDNLVYWKYPGFNLAEDVRLVCNTSGQVVGYADVFDVFAPFVKKYMFIRTDPAYLNGALYKMLYGWAVERGQQLVSRAPEGARVIGLSFLAAEDVEGQQAALAAGFEHVRNNYTMHIDFTTPPAAPVLPEGVVIRPMQRGLEEYLVAETISAAFADHWGYVKEPLEDMVRRYEHRLQNEPRLDAKLWLIAEVNGQVAGACVNDPFTSEDPQCGWVGSLGVLRPYRKMGLGTALLKTAFYEFYQRGLKSASLGVDASSLTGAVKVYEQAGMHIKRQNYMYEYELRPGVRLGTEHL